MTERRALTVTTSVTSPLEVGMWIEFDDDRPWWKKAWHWVIRHKHQTRFQITATTNGTQFQIEEPA